MPRLTPEKMGFHLLLNSAKQNMCDTVNRTEIVWLGAAFPIWTRNIEGSYKRLINRKGMVEKTMPFLTIRANSGKMLPESEIVSSILIL